MKEDLEPPDYGNGDWPNLTNLWHESIRECLYRPELITPNEAIRFDQSLRCSSMTFNFNLNELGLSRRRWSMLVKQYLDLGKTMAFVQKCVEIVKQQSKEGATACLYTNDVPPKFDKHYWGSCIMGFTFHISPDGFPVLTMNSRTSYVSYIGGIDLALARAIMVKTIKYLIPSGFVGNTIDETERRLQKVRFIWNVTSLSLPYLKSLPYMMNRPEYFRETPNTFGPLGCGNQEVVKHIERAFESVKKQNKSKFSPQIRVQEYYRKLINEEKSEDVPVHQLTLDPLFT